MKDWKYRITLIVMTILLSLPISTAFAEESAKWEIKTNMPEARAANAVAEVDGIIYSIGGSAGANPYKNVQAYNPKTNTWTKKSDMITARSGAAAAVYDGKIYVFGGYTGNFNTWSGGVALNTVEMYDPKTDTWSTKSNMINSVGALSVVTYKNKIYAFGGITTQSWSDNLVNVYDPVNDTWTPKKNMSQPIHGTGIVTYNDKIYLIGGRYIGPNYSQDKFQEYDPATDTWVAKTELPELRNAPSAVLYNDKIVVIGGSTPNVESTTVVSYDFKTNSWGSFAGLNDARTGSSAVVYNGKIYVIGGSSSTAANSAVGSVEVYGVDTPPVDPGPVDPQPTGDRAILVVTMTTGLEKEFDLPMTEVNAFIDWYEAKSNGTGSAKFVINKHNNNKGPFSSRRDYVIFDKILTFEVSEYTTK